MRLALALATIPAFAAAVVSMLTLCVSIARDDACWSVGPTTVQRYSLRALVISAIAYFALAAANNLI